MDEPLREKDIEDMDMTQTGSDEMRGERTTENNSDYNGLEKDELEIILESLPIGIMLLNRENKIRYLNKKFVELFGYEKDEIPDGRTWFRKAYPDSSYRHEIINTWLKDAESGFTNKKSAWILSVVCRDSSVKTINFIPTRLKNGDYLVSCEDINEIYNQENVLLYAINIDPLTGLPNRRSLETTLRQLIEKAKQGKQRGSRSAMIFANIDDFKEINQNYGHNTGDEIIIGMAKLLRKSLRSGDTAFRFEGDEFVVVLKSISMAEAKLAAERIQKTINQYTFILDYTKYNLSISMGIIPIDGTMDTTTLLANAVQTVQRSKKLGRNIISVY